MNIIVFNQHDHQYLTLQGMRNENYKQLYTKKTFVCIVSGKTDHKAELCIHRKKVNMFLKEFMHYVSYITYLRSKRAKCKLSKNIQKRKF